MTATLESVRTVRPALDEYAEFYAGYVARVGNGDIVERLERQIGATVKLLSSVSEVRAGFRYAAGKWSIREMVGHLCDAERIFTYRALRFARGDSTPLAGYDQDKFVANARFDDSTLASLVSEYEAIRRATVAFFESLGGEEWLRRGTANDYPVSVRALAWICAGHELHHREILSERYLSA